MPDALKTSNPHFRVLFEDPNKSQILQSKAKRIIDEARMAMHAIPLMVYSGINTKKGALELNLVNIWFLQISRCFG